MPIRSTPTPTATTNSILQIWVKKQGLTLAEFGRRMGYKSQMPYFLLGPKPTRLVTDDTIGRLLRAFGAEAVPVALELAKTLNQKPH